MVLRFRWAALLATVLALLLGCGALQTARAATAAASPVQVAIRIDNVYGFSERQKTYAVEGQLLLTLPNTLVTTLQRQQLTAIQLLSFENRIEEWNSRVEPITPEPRPVPGSRGQRLQQAYRFSGTFYADTINYRQAPFGMVPLTVNIQDDAGELADLGERIRLVPQPSQSTVGRRIGLTGYNLQNWQLRSRNNGVQMVLRYSPNDGAMVVKWILPLLITMLIMLLTPNISSAQASDRLSVPPVVLLTLVFLQQGYRETLPTLPYLTVLDQLYAVSYVVTLAFFCLFIWGSNRLQSCPEEQRIQAARRMDRWDLRLQACSVALYGLVVVRGLGWLP